MPHELTIGHLDPDAIPQLLAITIRQLVEEVIARVLAGVSRARWPRLCAGYSIAPVART